MCIFPDREAFLFPAIAPTELLGFVAIIARRLRSPHLDRSAVADIEARRRRENRP